MTGVLTILESIKSSKPNQYVLNYDDDENKGGITIAQLRNSLFKVIKGNDKTKHIARGSSIEFLSELHKKLWKFDAKNGIVSSLK